MTLFNGVVDGYEGAFIVAMFLFVIIWFIHESNEFKKMEKNRKEEFDNRHETWHVNGDRVWVEWFERHDDGALWAVINTKPNWNYSHPLERVMIVGGKQS